jgi:hypothetical protein
MNEHMREYEKTQSLYAVGMMMQKIGCLILLFVLLLALLGCLWLTFAVL